MKITVTKTVEVDDCHDCPYFNPHHDMNVMGCSHPKAPDYGYIVSWTHWPDGHASTPIPDNCPVKNGN